MTQQPTPFERPTPDPTETSAVSGVGLPSIVDTILDLDEFLSGDVRRAEKTARFATRPDLEADIEQAEYDLAAMVDAQGRPTKQLVDESIGDGSTGAIKEKAERIQELQTQYAASFRSVRLRALPDDEWRTFERKHRESLEKGGQIAKTFWDELIVKCAIAPVFTQAKLDQLRKKVGSPALADMEQRAWDVNTKSGVSVPKSPVSSLVLRRLEPAQN